MNAAAPLGKPDSICLQPPTLDVKRIALDVYNRTCRTNFDEPGFCVVNVGNSIDSVPPFPRTGALGKGRFTPQRYLHPTKPNDVSLIPP